MYHLQYYYIFVFCVFFLSKIIVVINAAYSEDDKNDIKIFVDLLDDIPTWDQAQTEFDQNELDQIEGIIINGVQNPGDVELNNKYERTFTALKCTYGYAVQNMLLNLKRLSMYDKSMQSQSNQKAQSSEVHVVNQSGSDKKVEPSKKKKVRFNDEVKLLAIDKENTLQISEIIKKKSVDLRNDMGFRAQNANNIVQNQLLGQEYVIDLSKNKRYRSPNLPLSNYHMYVEDYMMVVNRMLSVLHMAKRVAANWLWNVSIVLSAINWFQLKFETLWIRDDIQTAIDDFVTQCTAKKYLERAPPTKVHGFENDLKSMLESLNRSAVLLEYLRLAEITPDPDWTRLFKYQEKLVVYGCIWNRIPLDVNTMPWLQKNLIDWQKVERALSDAHKQVQDTWLNDPFLIKKYISMTKDVVFINMLYHLFIHFITYLEIRPWTIWAKILRLVTLSLTKPTDDTLDWFMKCPTLAFKTFFEIAGLNEDSFYSEVLEYMNDAKLKDHAKFQIITTKVALELEKYLRSFGVFHKFIYIGVSKTVVKNIPYADSTECRYFFNQVLETFVYINPSNLNIVNWFLMSENEVWLLDS
ncbi:uncharacterized protein LOC126835302 [Adelges cooleyi]|uniref:uncharacterized protein LOC126835302 n=1 Tax=Adelges cooleyi TaxID=133065 RepID=UPI00217F9AAD|nr:uncharacterized protein LOC126835302 [Adelges cooleyi]